MVLLCSVRVFTSQSVLCLQNKCMNRDEEPRHGGLPRSPQTHGNSRWNQHRVLLGLGVFAFAFLSLLSSGGELVVGMFVRVGRGGRQKGRRAAGTHAPGTSRSTEPGGVPEGPGRHGALQLLTSSLATRPPSPVGNRASLRDRRNFEPAP